MALRALKAGACEKYKTVSVCDLNAENFENYILQIRLTKNPEMESCRKSLSLLKLVRFNFVNRIQKKVMSQYASYYMEPVFRKADQDKLYESNEVIHYVNMPIKAPINNQTSSMVYDPLVRLFTNYVMKAGDKELARTVVERTFECIKRIQIEKYHNTKSEEAKANINLDPVAIFHKAIENAKPLLALEPIKRGAVVYQVPVPIKDKRSTRMAMKWFIEYGRDRARKKEHFHDKVSLELIEASMNRGAIIRQKQELHRQCEANRAYAHFRWV